jgi:hypothetical protein
MKDKNNIKIKSKPLPYLIGSLLLIFSIIFVYYLWNGNSLNENPATGNYYSQSSTSADN